MADAPAQQERLARERGFQSELLKARKRDRGRSEISQGAAEQNLERKAAQKQATLRSRSGVTTLDKRTGEIKEGIGGASSEEAARQNRERFARKSSDEAAMQNILRRKSKPSDEAARQNAGRRQGLSPGGRLRSARRRGRGQGDGGDPYKPSALGKSKEFPAGKPAEGSKEMEAFMRKWMGAMWLRTLWLWLKPSFGHTIYLINLTFFARLLSDYFKRWIPEVGSEWFYISPAMRVGAKGGVKKGRSSRASRSGSKAGIMVVKAGELMAMAFVTFLVVMIDIFVIVTLIFIILSFKKIVDIIPGV